VRRGLPQHWSMMRVEPNLAPVNFILTVCFGPALSFEILLRGTKARAPRSADSARAEWERRAPLLAKVCARVKPQSPRKHSKQHMVAIVLASKVYEGGSVRSKGQNKIASSMPIKEISFCRVLLRNCHVLLRNCHVRHPASRTTSLTTNTNY